MKNAKLADLQGSHDINNRGKVSKTWYSQDTALGHYMTKFENHRLNILQIIMHARCKNAKLADLENRATITKVDTAKKVA